MALFKGATPTSLWAPLARFLALVAAIFWSGSALAHEDHLHDAGFLTGLLHPALGFDHLLAMLSVGVLSAQIGGRAIWTVPATFVGVMILGSILGLNGVEVPGVEFGIATSVLVLGLVIVAYGWVPVWLAILCVALFAIFHGHAHGTEMPLIANAWAYGAGFVLGTSLIHLAGVGIGLWSNRLTSGATVLRALGGVVAACGLYLLVA